MRQDDASSPPCVTSKPRHPRTIHLSPMFTNNHTSLSNQLLSNHRTKKSITYLIASALSNHNVNANLIGRNPTRSIRGKRRRSSRGRNANDNGRISSTRSFAQGCAPSARCSRQSWEGGYAGEKWVESSRVSPFLLFAACERCSWDIVISWAVGVWWCVVVVVL